MTPASGVDEPTAAVRGAGLVLALAAFSGMLIEWIAAGLSSAPYSLLHQAASDLAAVGCGPLDQYEPPREVCSPAHGWVNGVWVVSGVLIAVTVLLVRHHIVGGRSRGLAVTGVALLAAGGMFQAAVGLVPLDVDLALHTVLALIGFVAQNLGMIVAGVSLRHRHRALGVAGIVGGAIGLASMVLFVAPTAWGLPFGLVERVAMYPYPLWLMAAGLLIAFGRSR